MKLLLLPHRQHRPPEEPIDGYNSNQNSRPLAFPSCLISKSMEDAGSGNFALIFQRTGIHTMASRIAVVCPFGELVDHHPLEDVGLVVDVMENVLPEHVEDGWRNEEASNTHPETVCKRRESQSNDEVGEEGGHQDDKRFGGEKVKEEPHDECEECVCSTSEVNKPVCDNGK